MTTEFKSGFIALIGRPNVGKSTLMNQLIGQKISIITDKIQTTRHAIRGIYSDEEVQMIFIDTPGIHKPKHRLGDRMVDVSTQVLHDADIILFLVDAKEKKGKGDQFIIEKLRKLKKPIFLVINKVDLVHPDTLLPLIVDYQQEMDFTEVVPISAKNSNNLSTLMNVIKGYLPNGPKYFDDEQITDRSERFMISELIREKVLLHTKEEVPHSVNVLIESFEERKNSVYIQALIITERDSQKRILIGKGGQMLKTIGKESRLDIEQLLEKKVFIDLWVKVVKDWRNKATLLNEYGFQHD